jgi:hypothetical protein
MQAHDTCQKHAHAWTNFRLCRCTSEQNSAKFTTFTVHLCACAGQILLTRQTAMRKLTSEDGAGRPAEHSWKGGEKRSRTLINLRLRTSPHRRPANLQLSSKNIKQPLNTKQGGPSKIKVATFGHFTSIRRDIWASMPWTSAAGTSTSISTSISIMLVTRAYLRTQEQDQGISRLQKSTRACACH